MAKKTTTPPSPTAAAFCEQSEPIETMLRRNFGLRPGVDFRRATVPLADVNMARIRAGESNSGRLARPVDDEWVATLVAAMPDGGDRAMPPIILYGDPSEGRCPDGAHRLVAASESRMFGSVNAYVLNGDALNETGYRRLSVVANRVLNGNPNSDDWRAEMAIEEWVEAGSFIDDSDRVARLYEIKPATFKEQCKAEVVCNVLRECEETRRVFGWFSQRCRSCLYELLPDERSVALLALVFHTHRVKDTNTYRAAVKAVMAKSTPRTRQSVIASIDRDMREAAEEKSHPLRTDPTRLRKYTEQIIAILSRSGGLGGIGFRSGEIGPMLDKLNALRDIINRMGDAKP